MLKRVLLASLLCSLTLLPLCAAKPDSGSESAAQSTSPQQATPLYGYTAASSPIEREWEQKLRAIPDPKILVPYYPLRGDGSRAVKEVAKRHRATTAQVMLAWLLARSPAMLPIPGTLSLAHLKENLGAAALELTRAEISALG